MKNPRGDIFSRVLGETRMPVSHSSYKPVHGNGNGQMTTVVVCYAVHIVPTAEIGEYTRTSPRPRPADRVLVSLASLLLLLTHGNVSAASSDRWPNFLIVLDTWPVSNGRVREVRSAAKRCISLNNRVLRDDTSGLKE